MVTLGSIQPATFQAFHGSAPYDNTLNFQSFELALNDVSDLDVPSSATTSDPVEEIAVALEPAAKPARRGSLVVPPLANRSVPDEVHRSPAARPAYTQSSASHRLFRPAEPELKSWHAHLPSDEVATGIIGPESTGAGRIESRSRASSWHASDLGRRRSPLRGFSQQRKDEQTLSLTSTSPAASCALRRSREDRPTNEILDGSDVLQQISNLTSTEPSNEREVFVGGLRESEDAVHITEEELATYFAKFGVIESVSINRDDRTQRGRGFAFVKFFQEAAALNAVVADASTHVIRGTTVSVQWSRGAKDAGGDRPRRRNSATSATSSNNGCSPSRGSNRSSPKMNMFGHKGGGHRGSGGGGGGSCGAGCNHGFSPMRSRSQGHIHGASGAGGGVPYSFCNGGRHSEHHNQQMVCVVVPAQRAAALGLSQHSGHLPSGSCSSRGSPPRDSHFAPFIQSGAHGSGGHSGYPSHTRSHSSAAPLSSSSGHVSVGGSSSSGGGGGGGGYGHRASQGGGDQHHAMTAPHHVSPKSGRSYGAPPPMQMPPVHHERRGRTEPRGYPPAAASSGGGGGGSGSGTSAFSEYERTKYDSSCLHSSSYSSSEWGGDNATGSSRGMAHGMMRSQSPPDAAPSVISSSRNGGGAPRPPPTPPRGYEQQYTSTRYTAGPVGRATDGFPSGISMTGRRHSGSSVMSGRNSMRQDAIAAMNCYYSVDDMANEYAFDAEYPSTTTTAAPSRLA